MTCVFSHTADNLEATRRLPGKLCPETFQALFGREVPQSGPPPAARLHSADFGSQRTEDLAMFGFLRLARRCCCHVVNLITQVSAEDVKLNLAFADDLSIFHPEDAAIRSSS
jgi:hypothetical protein